MSKKITCGGFYYDDTTLKMEDGVLSAVGGGSVTVDQTYNPDSENAQSGKAVAEAISGKQDTLTAGDNITIEDNVISATGGSGGDSEFYTRTLTNASFSYDGGEGDYSAIDLTDNGSITDTVEWVTVNFTGWEATGDSLLVNDAVVSILSGSYNANLLYFKRFGGTSPFYVMTAYGCEDIAASPSPTTNDYCIRGNLTDIEIAGYDSGPETAEPITGTADVVVCYRRTQA